MGIEIKITDNAGEFLKALPEQVEQALTAIGIAGETNAKKEITRAVYDTKPSPNYVRTGRLRNSLTHAVDMGQQCVILGSNVEYAAPVELGTSRMKARPYLRPAVADYADEYRKLAEMAMRGKGT